MGILGISPTVIANQCLDRYFDAFGLHSRLVELDNGTTMHCWMPKFPSIMQEEMWRSSGKPSLVLLHAFGLDAYTWGRQVSRFSKSFDLYIPDLVFSGKSFTTSKERSEIFQVCANIQAASCMKSKSWSQIILMAAPLYACHVNVDSESACTMESDSQYFVRRIARFSTLSTLLPLAYSQRICLCMRTNFYYLFPGSNTAGWVCFETPAPTERVQV